MWNKAVILWPSYWWLLNMSRQPIGDGPPGDMITSTWVTRRLAGPPEGNATLMRLLGTLKRWSFTGWWTGSWKRGGTCHPGMWSSRYPTKWSCHCFGRRTPPPGSSSLRPSWRTTKCEIQEWCTELFCSTSPTTCWRWQGGSWAWLTWWRTPSRSWRTDWGSYSPPASLTSAPASCGGRSSAAQGIQSW